MEHSYSRDWKPNESPGSNRTRTLMVHRPPQCPSCHNHSAHSHDDIDIEDSIHPIIPAYNEETAKVHMDECFNVSKQIKNNHSDDEEWETKIPKYSWTPQQLKLFFKLVRLLDLDRLARLANTGKTHEAVHRRTIIDKSVDRLRKVFASVFWDTKLTQWIHNLMLDSLPPSYLAIYMDALQTLKSKVPSLTDRIIFGRPGNINQDLVGHILKKPWEPQVAYKNRKLPGSPFIVVVPSAPALGQVSGRMQQWYTLFTTMASVVPIQVPVAGSMIKNQSLQSVIEQLMFATRAKLQEIRNEAPERQIILVGFNAGAALALQIGMVEPVNCIISIGFACNTITGVRGVPDDHILDISAPVLFIIGQNAAKSSPEEIESLREKMPTSTSLVVVGSADDALRVGKTKRKIEGITQSMIDSMVIDEIADFATNCLENPQKYKPVTTVNPARILDSSLAVGKIGSSSGTPVLGPKKRKLSELDSSDGLRIPKKVGRPKLEKPDFSSTPIRKPLPSRNKLISLTQPSGEVLDAAVQSIMPKEIEHEPSLGIAHIESKKLSPIPTVKSEGGITKLEIKPANAQKHFANSSITFTTTPTLQKQGQTFKVISGNQFIQLKPTLGGTSEQKFMTIKSQPSTKLPSSVVGTSKIYTLKTGTSGSHLVPIEGTAKSVHQAPNVANFSPTKFTIMKSTGQTTNTVSPDSSSTTASAEDSADYSNILDMPVVFADNEGNIQPEVTSATFKPVTSSIQAPQKTQFIIQKQPSQGTTQLSQIQPGKQIVISNVVSGQKPKPGNVVLLNKSTMKPITTIVSKAPNIQSGLTTIKYAKLVTTSAGQKIVIPASAPSSSTSSSAEHKPSILTTLANPKKIEILSSSIVKQADNKFTPIIINMDNKGSQIKTIVRKPEIISGPGGQVQVTKGTGSIVIRPNILKQTPITAKAKPTILNRSNLTVKRVINVIPVSTANKPPTSDPS